MVTAQKASQQMLPTPLELTGAFMDDWAPGQAMSRQDVAIADILLNDPTDLRYAVRHQGQVQ